MTIDRLVARKNGEGRTVWMVGSRMEVKLLASETGDAGPPDMAKIAEAAARHDIEIPPPPG